MNLTKAGTTQNTESVLPLDYKPEAARQEFERFWNDTKAVRVADFELAEYEGRRLEALSAVKAAGAADVLDADVQASADSHLVVDALKEGWRTFFEELKSCPDGIEGHECSAFVAAICAGPTNSASLSFPPRQMPENFPLPPDHNIAPATFQAVIRLNRDTGEREMVMMSWGLGSAASTALPVSECNRSTAQGNRSGLRTPARKPGTTAT